MPSSTKKARTSDSLIRVRLNIKDSDMSLSKTMDSPVRIFRTITNNAASTGSPDKQTAPKTETISALLKKKEQLKKLRDFTRQMEEDRVGMHGSYPGVIGAGKGDRDPCYSRGSGPDKGVGVKKLLLKALCSENRRSH